MKQSSTKLYCNSFMVLFKLNKPKYYVRYVCIFIDNTCTCGNDTISVVGGKGEKSDYLFLVFLNVVSLGEVLSWNH